VVIVAGGIVCGVAGKVIKFVVKHTRVWLLYDKSFIGAEPLSYYFFEVEGVKDAVIV
jgi:hypothetical protein